MGYGRWEMGDGTPLLSQEGCRSRFSANGGGGSFGVSRAQRGGMKRRRLIHNIAANKPRGRQLRENLTPAEALLWTNLKNSQLDGKKFRRQHGVGPYFVDFYCPECRLAVELDGDGHMTDVGAERD